MAELKDRGAAISRRLRSAGGRVLRRAGLLPVGVADGLGEDDNLDERVFDGKIVAFFPNTPSDIPDLQVSYRVLESLDDRFGLVLVVQDSRVAARVRRESRLEVVTVALYATLDAVLSRSSVEMALYFSDHAWNFSMLRFTSLVHVLLIADSDLAERVANQVKAYDYCLARTSGVVETLAALVDRFEADRCLQVHGERNAHTQILDQCDVVLGARGIEWQRLKDNGAVGP